ncbi:MAG: EAL domain-containing protein [Leptospiraceae bacterium]|nr:EAL domain-containing protein [Leptospiraceae bacterium]
MSWKKIRNSYSVDEILNIIPGAVIVHRNWEILYANEAAAALYGAAGPDEMMGLPVSSLMDGHLPTIVEKSLPTLPLGQTFSLTFQLHRKDGSNLSVDSYSTAFATEEGPAILAIIRNRDRTQNDRSLSLITEIAARTGTEYFSELSRSLCRHLGLSGAVLGAFSEDRPLEDLESFRAVSIFHEGESQKPAEIPVSGTLAECVIQDGYCLVADSSTQIASESCLKRNGFRSGAGILLYDSNQKPNGVLVVYSNKVMEDPEFVFSILKLISVRAAAEIERQQARLNLQKSERKSRLLMERAADGIFLLDSLGRIQDANPSGLNLLGDPENVKGEPIQSFVQESEFLSEKGDIALQRVRFQAGGNPRTCEVSSVRLPSGQMQLIARDITDRLLTEAKYGVIFEGANDAIFLAELVSGAVLEANQQCEEILGLPRDQFLEMPFTNIFPEEQQRRIKRLFDYFLRQRKYGRGRLRLDFHRKDGSVLPVEISTRLIEDANQSLVVGVIRDISDSVRADQERKSHLTTLSLLEEAVIELDQNLRVRNVNEPFEKFFGAQEKSTIGQSFPQLVHRDFRDMVTSALTSLLRGRSRVRLRFPVLSAETGMSWYEGKFIAYSERDRTAIRGLIRDTTLDYISEKQRHFAAYHDNLTGLPNRTRMEEDIQKALLNAEAGGQKVAVGLMDLDHFFNINEILGHKMGDRVLALFAEKLRTIPELKNGLYRWGGDQFVFLVDQVSAMEKIRELAGLLMELIRLPMEVESEKVHVTCSVGVALYPDDGANLDEIVGQADRALNYAKKQGRFNYKFASDLPKKAFYQHQLSIRNHLVEAIQNRLIEPFFQPIVAAGSHRIVGMEALARWPNTNGLGKVGPDAFIPLAENMGLIADLGRTVLEKALDYHSRLKKSGFDLELSVNISRRQLFSRDLARTLQKMVEEAGLSPSDVVLEITESIAMLEVENATAHLLDLHQAGFRLAIDDFGTGYSTLAQLHEMPVDEIKIDRAFVQRINTGEGYRILQAITGMAAALGLTMVAEGVEDQGSLGKLEGLGVHSIQGFYFSPPVEAEEFTRILKGHI